LAAVQKEFAAFEETAQQKDREELLGNKKDEEVVFLWIIRVPLNFSVDY
jgi:hypothetical protein